MLKYLVPARQLSPYQSQSDLPAGYKGSQTALAGGSLIRQPSAEVQVVTKWAVAEPATAAFVITLVVTSQTMRLWLSLV